MPIAPPNGFGTIIDKIRSAANIFVVFGTGNPSPTFPFLVNIKRACCVFCNRPDFAFSTDTLLCQLQLIRRLRQEILCHIIDIVAAEFVRKDTAL